MTQRLASVLFALSMVLAESAAAQETPRANKFWTSCSEEESSDCQTNPSSYVWPDSRFAIGATLDAVFRHTDNELFMESGPKLRIGALASYDVALVDGTNPGIVAIEGGYRIEQSAASDLFGGEVSTAMTSHDIYAGASYKILWDRSLDPPFGAFVRVVVGAGIGSLVVRDARSRERSSDGSAAPFYDIGLGFVVRMLGLLVEGGYEFGWPREFEIEQSFRQSIKVSRDGWYLRSGVVIHLP